MEELRAQWRAASLDSQLYWRVHPSGRPFGPEDATSTTFNEPRRTSKGYSCFDDPWHLWLYLDANRMYEAAKAETVIGFTGEKIGVGNDGEDLVMPDMKTVRRMPFSSFEAELAGTPLPGTPRFSDIWPDGAYRSWRGVRRLFSDFEPGDDPLIDRILAKASGSSIKLYHGTLAEYLPSIKAQGLKPPEGMGFSANWFMLTTSFEQAARYASGRGDPIVIEYDIPLSKIWDHGVQDALLWPGGEHNAYIEGGATAYALRQPLPGSFIVRVHQVGAGEHTAMPSWRGLMRGPIWTEHPAVILVDKGGMGRQTYEVYVDGEQIGRGQRLDEAKRMAEEHLGPCSWSRAKQEPIKTEHYYFGPQTWFGDPSIAYVGEPLVLSGG